MKYISIILLFLLLGCRAERPSGFSTVCAAFDQADVATLLADAEELMDNPSAESKSYARFTLVYPITNSLVVFGDSAKLRSNSLSIATHGLGSYRAGITFNRKDDGEMSVYYWSTRNTGEGYNEKEIYPQREKD